ncbi:hypothetical protein [Pseudotamlana carrageenivorans]|uniref:Uncharacterized protein n=1 Tax=Pseudotamlana carrageenivorans TaxID=2069432 RepID=A0A2I7SFT2_9FLAO|nr:hypothetical protein [Tamlana carrageenivorans]AUS04763.1 hypothetical protein C1A40_04415 [Tamlana carrageenivorans]
MKIFTIILSIIALGLIIFNCTQLDFNAPFEGQSMVAIITIMASLCVIVMMAILRTSKHIEQKIKNRK